MRIAEAPWLITDLSQRVQHYGWRYDYRSRDVGQHDPRPLFPCWATLMAELADKAYDAEWIRAMIAAQDAVPIIPDRGTAKTTHACCRELYRLRNRVERFVNKLKQFRRIATRYEKLVAN